MLEKDPDMIQYVFIFVAFRIIYNLIYAFSLIYFFSVMIINNHYFLKFLINQSVCLIFIFIFV